MRSEIFQEDRYSSRTSGLGVVRDALGSLDNPPALPWQKSVSLGEKISELRRDIGPDLLDAARYGKSVMPEDRIEKYNEYKESVNRLAEGNMGLIWTVFNSYPRLYHRFAHDVQDLVGKAQERLIRCAELYDPWHSPDELGVANGTKKPHRFSTYAGKSLFLSLKSECREFLYMHIPENQWIKLARYQDACAFVRSRMTCPDFGTTVLVADLMGRLKRMPTTEEIEEARKQAKENDSAHRRHRNSIRNYKKLISLFDPVRLDEEAQETVRDDFGELSPEAYDMESVIPSGEDVAREVDGRILEETLRRVVETRLLPSEQQVIEMRYRDGKSLSITASRLGVTPGCVSEKERRVLRKLRHPEIRRMLRDFLY